VTLLVKTMGYIWTRKRMAWCAVFFFSSIADVDFMSTVELSLQTAVVSRYEKLSHQIAS